mgnify:CR=1 FL=1
MYRQIISSIVQDVLDANQRLVSNTSRYTDDLYNYFYSTLSYNTTHNYYITEVDRFFIQAKRIYNAMNNCLVSKTDIVIDMLWRDSSTGSIYRDGRGDIIDDSNRRIILSNIINNTFYKYFSNESVTLDIQFQVVRHDILLSPDRFIIRHLDTF